MSETVSVVATSEVIHTILGVTSNPTAFANGLSLEIFCRVTFNYDRKSDLPTPERPKGDFLSIRSIPCYSAINRKREHLQKGAAQNLFAGKSRVNPFAWFWYTTLLALHNTEVRIDPDPKIPVDYFGLERFDQELPRGLFHGIGDVKSPDTPMLNRIRWSSIPTVGQALKVLAKRSYFSSSLRYAVDENGKAIGRTFGLRNFVSRYFLGYDLSFAPPESGVPRPTWESRKPNEHRMKRFLRVLHNVDGLIIQLLLSFPECNWTYQLLDLIAVQTMVLCMQDEALFPTASKMELDSTWFKTMKNFRKKIKYLLHLEGKDKKIADRQLWGKPALNWLTRFTAQMGTSESQFTILTGLYMCQTRGCSTPIDAVMHATALGFIKTVTYPSEPVCENHARVLEHFVKKVVKRFIPPLEIERSLRDALLSIGASSCSEETNTTGGKYEHTRKLFQKDPVVFRIDLETGNPVGVPGNRKSFPTDGDYIFHWSLNQLMTPSLREYYRKVIFLIIAEPGKGRGITKTPFAWTMVLAPAAHICLSLIEHIPSSKAGVAKGHPCWDLYKRLDATIPENHEAWYSDATNRAGNHDPTLRFDKEDWNSVFSLRSDSESETTASGSVPRPRRGDKTHQFMQETTFKRLFGFCTDYSEATDHTDWNISRILLGSFLDAIGFPKWYGKLVVDLLHSSRLVKVSVRFDRNDGSDIDVEVETNRGILMGDPITKVVLHLINIISNELCKWFAVTYARAYANARLSQSSLI